MFDRGDIVAQNSVPDISKGVDKKSNASDSCLPSLRYLAHLMTSVLVQQNKRVLSSQHTHLSTAKSILLNICELF